ncbi:TBC1 domain family member 15-like [Anneissia japonica]|uniref:TBC1 domain family member 15-like n=1 Tax=Anneissia japonica TaxID=1529436 RepID=UPI0014258D73|nr:TBC1 domain family member 15-like [Anneissia japonica]
MIKKKASKKEKQMTSSSSPQVQKKDFSKVVFEKGSVFIHTTQGEGKDDVLLGGKVNLISKSEGAFIDWHPLSECDFEDDHPETDWTVVNTVGYKKAETENISVHQARKKSKYAMTFSLHDVKSIRRSKPDLGWAYLLFTLNDNVSLPALHFHDGGSSVMLRKIEKYVTLTRCPTDIRLFTVTPHNSAALTRSIDELQVLGEHSANYVHNFFKDPTVIMGGFSKVTNFVRDTLSGQPAQKFRPFDEYAELMPDMIGLTIEPSLANQASYEMIAERKLGPRPEVTRGGTVTPNEWAGHVDSEGRIVDVDGLKEKIFRGGLCASLRQEAWKFLLGYFDWNSTTKERKLLRKKKEDEYFCMKAQWKTISEDQEKRFGILRERRNVVDKDVLRTDRMHPYYAGDNNPHLEMLYDNLMTYCQYNFDLGYVQGMSDMLSPILQIMDDEVDAFWCFSGFMDQPGMMSNFDLDQAGMKKQLIQLSTLLQFLDPDLFVYLDSKECSNMYFCFRWLLIRFKREFTYEDISLYWEMMWTGLPCNNFHLLMCLAILDTEKDTMIQEDFGFNEILKHINGLSLKIDMEDTLKKAEGIYLQLRECENLPLAIKEIIEVIPDTSLRDSDSSSIEILDDVVSDDVNGKTGPQSTTTTTESPNP